MHNQQSKSLTTDVSARMQSASAGLIDRWIDSISAASHVDSDRDLSPAALRREGALLLEVIAAFLDGTDEIRTDTISRAVEFAEPRLSDGFGLAAVIGEYTILGDLLYAWCRDAAGESTPARSQDDVLVCAQRVHGALSALGRAVAVRYQRIMSERVAERDERLRRFNRLITHELKNRVGATLGAGQLLQEEWLGVAERQRFAGMVAENAQAIRVVLENMSALSRPSSERRRQRDVVLSDVIAEVFGRLRGLARGRGVDMRVRGELPDVEVNANAVDVCLSNYLSNAVAFSDPAAAERWAEVTAVIERNGDAAELVVRVRDNGLGVPADVHDRLFERFFRGHADISATEGSGLGLSLVRETAASHGGRAWAELAEGAGSVFAFALPCRSGEERSACRTLSGSDGARPENGALHSGGAPERASG